MAINEKILDSLKFDFNNQQFNKSHIFFSDYLRMAEDNIGKRHTYPCLADLLGLPMVNGKVQTDILVKDLPEGKKLEWENLVEDTMDEDVKGKCKTQSNLST